MQMTGKTALEAHRMMNAIAAAMKFRGGDATPDRFLHALIDAGYDVVKLPEEPVTEASSDLGHG